VKFWRNLARRLDERTRRERLLIVGTTVAILILFTDQLVLQALLDDQAQLKRDLRASQTAIQEQNEEIARLQVILAKDPNERPRREIAQLHQEISAIEQRIAETTNRLVDPRKMAEVLGAILERGERLRLIRLTNLEPQPLSVMSEDGVQESEAYRHGLRIEFQGSFNDTLAYLEQLEALPWEFFWEGLEISAEAYPLNRVTVEVYTISIGRQWFGV
jgi:MSHA biogenesis protein MshJ